MRAGPRCSPTDASDVGMGGTLYQWQDLNPAQVAWVGFYCNVHTQCVCIADDN